MTMSKTQAKKLRKRGDLRAPQVGVGRGHTVYSGFGSHANKKRKLLQRLGRDEASGRFL